MANRTRLALVFVVVAVAIAGVMHLRGCALVTTSTEHQINFVSDDAPGDGIRVYVSFSATPHRQVRVPGIYDRVERHEPYHCYYTIWGPFESITSVDVTVTVNGGPAVPVHIDLATLNAARKTSDDGNPLFPYGLIPFDHAAHDIETVEIRTSFSAISNGAEQRYEIKNKFGLTTSTHTGNRWWSGIMGI